MRFWDASAIVPLCCRQPTTPPLERLARLDTTLIVWWGTPVEIVSALSRLHREGGLTANELELTVGILRALRDAWVEVMPGDAVRERAERLLRVHTLRAADAFQLAAAMAWTNDRPTGQVVVTMDDRLRTAATREGFTVQP